jgi:hypothetical protein
MKLLHFIGPKGLIVTRVARFSFVRHTKKGKNYQCEKNATFSHPRLSKAIPKSFWYSNVPSGKPH